MTKGDPMMKTTPCILISLLCLTVSIPSAPESNARSGAEKYVPRLQNPMTTDYLVANIRKSRPRLVLNAATEKNLRSQFEVNQVVRNVYKAVQLNAARIQTEPLLKRILEGRRLLAVSREMLYRMNMLGMVYRLERNSTILRRINDEVMAVCRFTDWNPSHFLDVAEMSLAVAIALDWTAGDLPRETIETAETALIEKGIKPSYNKAGNTGWINGTNNWNQVCHGGMIAASIAIADRDPELAARTISRALDGMPHALAEYGPDGVYPEGSTYWSYGTSFSVMTAAIFESAFGTDFGLGGYPAFQESAVFRVMSNAPSGWYYNFADCGDRRSRNGDLILAWFAARTGNRMFLEKERFMQPPEEMGKLSRLDGAALVWLAQYREKTGTKRPPIWKGGGANPVVFFTGGEEDPHQYYFGGKGGRGSVNHGNMDAGSFVFELNGVRWVIDPGNQPYHDLEKTGFDLWGRCQDCQRWTLLTKNNFGHSTISVDDKLHSVDGLATIVDFKEGERPEATIDLTPVFQGQLRSARRRFVKDGRTSLLIEDQVELLDSTRAIAWQLMTTAEVIPGQNGALLRQNDQELKLDILLPRDANVSLISLSPAPLKLDRQIEALKRIEIRIPAWTFEGGNGRIAVRLSGKQVGQESPQRQ
jgi:hypothetical protein